MAAPPVFRNPFHLPELRYRLSRFVTLKDALSCILVSKAWTHDFISAIWFKVDLKAHPLFANLPPDVIAKHGRHIRIVENLASLYLVSTFTHPTINKLRFLQIETIGSDVKHTEAYEIIARNNTSVEHLDLFASYFTENPDHPNHYVSASAFVALSVASPGGPAATSVLTTLEMTQLRLTHDSLMTILEATPALSKIRLPVTTITGTPSRSFQHAGVTLLAWEFKSIFPEDQTTMMTTSPSLLSYFPNLTILHTWTEIWTDDSSYTIPTDRIRKDLSRYCPRLAEYKLVDYSGKITPEFLTNIATNVTRITTHLECLTPETITAIVLHKATLKKVAHFYYRGFHYDDDQVATVSNDLQVTDEMVQEIPRKCSKLERLNLHGFEMDMDVVESGEWTCKDLRKLRIRVRGLDTKEKILRAIALWRAGCWRRRQERATGIKAAAVEEKQLEADHSIEARVARHLLKFEQLQLIWLGYQMWTLI
ncbi:MAG: hypothetical protein J3R72DRAFT_448758 [Linnemannia gamsii]|nr:MAG: hypothetical protein J3R72DRAFT_448758 [Linnemannia gamsii]